MVFSSILFIYCFLPILLLCYYITPNKYKNYILLFFSLLFYFVGEPKYFIILIMSCLINYFIGKYIEKGKKRKLLLIIGVFYNIFQLFIFKYADFFIRNINIVLPIKIPLLYLIMPIGISFFTFQNLSYIIDIYNKKHESCKKILDYMVYISLFPQLIAGPIVRYQDISNSLKERKYSYSGFVKGIRRFIFGLSKKILIADVMSLFASKLVTDTIVSVWLRPICYTFQIYFDFSGYSDMAIGLGLMLGFIFPENFNYPLTASSITDFWRRWHMTLSSWFRDYVYIPLGGNRNGLIKQLRNIVVVWMLTGFWHGANWNFILWGIYFAIVLMIEKLFLLKQLNKTKVIKYIYSFILIVVGFYIFNASTVSEIFSGLKMMFTFNLPFIDKVTIYYLQNFLVIFIIAIIFATPLIKNIILKIKNTKFKIVIDVLEPVVYLSLLALSTAYLIDSSFSPFLYFRF